MSITRRNKAITSAISLTGRTTRFLRYPLAAQTVPQKTFPPTCNCGERYASERENMKYLIALLLLSPILQAAELPIEKVYDKRMSRLYTCGKFFNIVGNQRKSPEEKNRYKSLSESSIKLANNLIGKHQE